MSAQREPLNVSSIPVPEPELTPREMIRRAEALRPLLRARQEATEAAGNMSAETNAELIKARFYRVVQPRIFGGYEFDFPTYMRVGHGGGARVSRNGVGAVADLRSRVSSREQFSANPPVGIGADGLKSEGRPHNHAPPEGDPMNRDTWSTRWRRTGASQ